MKVIEGSDVPDKEKVGEARVDGDWFGDGEPALLVFVGDHGLGRRLLR